MGISLLNKKVFDIRKGEYLKAFLMFAYIFLIIATVLILKPIRNSLFLSRFGAEKLPYVFMLVALFAAVFTAMGSREKARRTAQNIMTATLVFSIVCLSAFWGAFRSGITGGWILYLFYVWVSIFSVVTAAQFWLLANQIYDSRQARRLFGFLGAGAVSGGIFGGYLTRVLAATLKTENLILVCTGFIVICISILRIVFRKSADELSPHRSRKRYQVTTEEEKGVLKEIAGSSLLLYIASIIGIGVIVATLADYQFDAIASGAIKDKDDLTAFFGFWLSNLNILSLIIQVFLTSRVLKSFGVGLSLFFLPIGLLVGSFGMLAMPALWTAILIKFSDGAFKHSINKSGIELLYMPVPDLAKRRVKTFIDVGIKNIATGLAGLVLIMLTSIAGLPIRFVSVASLLLISVWLILVLRVKREYVEAFRQAILKRSIDIDQQQVNLEDAAVFDTFVKVLEGTNERQISYVLDLLGGSGSKRLRPFLARLLEHPSMDIKLKILEIAQGHDSPDLSEEAMSLIDCDDVRVSGAAVYYCCGRADDIIERLRTLLASDDPRIRCSAMTAAARFSAEGESIGSEIDLREYIDDTIGQIDSPATSSGMATYLKVRLVELVGASADPALYPFLERFLEDGDSDIRCAASRSAARIKTVEAVPILIDHIGDSKTRTCAMESLFFGESAIDILSDTFEDGTVERKIRLKIPKVIGMIGSQRSVDILTDKLGGDWDPHLNYEILKGLVTLRMNFRGLKFDRGKFEKYLNTEVRKYHKILSIIRRFDGPGIHGEKGPGLLGGASAEKGILFLKRVLDERRMLSLKRIFRLLGLRYPPRDMYNSYLGITSERKDLRANALEFLDNVLSARLKRTIVPIMEHFHDPMGDAYLPVPEGFTPLEDGDMISQLLDHEDKWVRISSLYLIGEIDYPDCARRVGEIAKDADPVLRETAEWCMKKLGASA